MIVAIDGPAASGKSTVARMLAERLGLRYLDTGAMYRAVTLRALQEGVVHSDRERLGELARTADIDFVDEPAGPSAGQKVLLAGRDVTERIREEDVTNAVSPVSAVPEVRAAMVERQREVGSVDSVVEGRDIGSVVFPNAELKVFLTASPEERARRRRSDFAGQGRAMDERAVREDIDRRDELDSGRRAAPLTRAPDAVLIDTTGKEPHEVVSEIVKLIGG